MSTKKEILDYFSELDEITLSRVYEHSKVVKMLYPESDLLLNANMSQMLTKANELASIHLPEWTDRAEGDFGQFLVELVALFSEKDFWYNNAFHLEGNILDAQLYYNVYTKAHQMGYDASVQKAPILPITLSFEALDSISAGGYRVIVPGEIEVVTNGLRNRYTNPFPIPVPDSLALSNVSVNFYKGIFKSTSFTFEGFSIFIDDANIDPSTLSVIIDEVSWERVNQFGLSSSESKVFLVLPDDNARATLFFGDGLFGKKPALGSTVFVSYLKTDGVDETGIDTLTINKTAQTRALISAIPNDLQSSGGKLFESIESIRKNAIRVSRTRDTIINTQDCKDFLLTLPDVRRAYASFSNTAITLFCLGRDGLVLSTSRLDEIILLIQERMVQLGYSVLKGVPSFVTLPDMDILVECMPNSDFASIKSKVQQAARNYYDPLVSGDFGRPFIYDDFYIALKSADPKNILRINMYPKGFTNVQYADTLPLLNNEIISAPVVTDGLPTQNIFITAQSI